VSEFGLDDGNDLDQVVPEASQTSLVRGVGVLAGTTARSLAAAAPEIARGLMRNRQQLLNSAMRLPWDPAAAVPALIAPTLDGLGARLVRLTLALVDDPQTQQDLAGLTRLSGARALGQLVPISVLDRVVGLLGVPDARLRVSLVSSQLLGLAAARTVVRIEPLASMPAEEIVGIMGPMLQRLLDPTSPTVRP